MEWIALRLSTAMLVLGLLPLPLIYGDPGLLAVDLLGITCSGLTVVLSSRRMRVRGEAR